MYGNWKSFTDLEENVSLEELQIILEHGRKRDHQQRQFQASLAGHKYPDWKDSKKEETSFEEVKKRAQARLSGKSVEELTFGDIGIAVIEE